MTGLAASDIDRLGKLLGMLGSDHEGERASAALMADRLVRERGTTWPQLLGRVAQSSRSHLPHRQTAFECLAVAELWSEREVDFLKNMTRRRKGPTEGQAKWLSDLRERLDAWRQAA